MKLVKSDYDQFTGMTEEFWYEEPQVVGGPGRITIRRYQDVEHTLALNKVMKNDKGNVGYGDSDGLHKVATIPLSILENIKQEKGIDWFNSTDKDRRKILNDGEFSDLLVRPGKL